MYRGLDPGEMIPEERANEVAGILAQGFLRLRENGLLSGASKAEPESKNSATDNISNGCGANKSSS